MYSEPFGNKRLGHTKSMYQKVGRASEIIKKNSKIPKNLGQRQKFDVVSIFCILKMTKNDNFVTNKIFFLNILERANTFYFKIFKMWLF